MSLPRFASGSALSLLLMIPSVASAGWDNVFQLTCCGPRTSARIAYAAPAPVVSYYAAPAPCCPQTQYVQRSFYQPITTYKPVVDHVPVTSYRTSYYWEPVASCSYSMYVDPCTGCAQQVATPTTSYYLRSQCNAVQSYVQRVSYQPVVEQRLSYYLEPVAVNPCAASVAVAPAVAAPIATSPPPLAAPSTSSDHVTPAPSTVQPPLNINQPPSMSEKIVPNTTAQPRGMHQPIRPDRVASRGSDVTGVVVRSANQPFAFASMRFVSTTGGEQSVSSDSAGRFSVNLASGSWKIYVNDGTSRPVVYDFVARGNETRNVTLAARQ